MMYTYHYESPLGDMTMASNGTALLGLWFDGQKYFESTLSEEREEKKLAVFEETARWLDLYFAGKNPEFTPPVVLQGSEFRLEVWKILQSIPYGKTMTYGEIAEKIAEKKGKPHMSAQAVGGAVGHNPISLIIPCHRVLGANKNLTGYAGGIEKKAALLKLEGAEL